MRRHFLLYILIIIILIFSSSSTTTYADGMFLTFDDSNKWNLFDENKQFSFIDYNNGVQKMIITLNLIGESNASKAVWIFPVPARPDEVNISFVEGFPSFGGFGRDIEGVADWIMSEEFEVMWSTQIYPAPILLSLKEMGLVTKGVLQSVHVHKTISYVGLNAELISADDTSSLWNYLSQKGLILNKKAKSLLKHYVGKGYSFVVSWISGEDFKDYLDYVNSMQELAQNEQFKKYFEDELTEHVIGISITFPTKEIYYPLKLTSIYNNRKIPIIIYVLGYVNPRLYLRIRPGTEVKYITGATLEIPEGLEEFFKDYNKDYDGNKVYINNVEYTRIKINTSSKHLTHDLWIKPSKPLKVRLIESMDEPGSLLPIIMGLVIFILCSCLASLFSAMIVFRDRKISKLGFMLFGLWNSLTLIGFSIMAYVLKVDERFTIPNNSLPYSSTKKTKIKNPPFLKVFLGVVFASFLIMILLSSLFMYLSHTSIIFNRYFLHNIIILLIVYSPMVLILTPLAWLYYKNRKVMWFVILFSAFFLILTFISRLILILII